MKTKVAKSMIRKKKVWSIYLRLRIRPDFYHNFDVMNISLRFTTPVENSVFRASPTCIKCKLRGIKKKPEQTKPIILTLNLLKK